MSYLFVDSTYDLSVGLLHEDCHWLDFQHFAGQKSSMIIQSVIYQQLKKCSLSVPELKGIISVMGPGFYTGLRVSEGLTDVFEFLGVNVYSFYSYEIPFWTGVQDGVWLTKAYRGEYFLHEWKGVHHAQHLLSQDELFHHWQTYEQRSCFVHSEISLDEFSKKLLGPVVHTSDLLQQVPQKIFPHLLHQSLKKTAFYFRPPEDEFRVNPGTFLGRKEKDHGEKK